MEKQEDLKSELSGKILKYFNTVNHDSTIILDSIKIYDIDTLNQKSDSANVIYTLSDKFNEYNEEINPIGEQIKSDLQLMKLSNGLSSTLYNNYKDEYETHMSKYKSINNKMKDIASRMDRIRLLANGNTLDSLKATGYAAKFNIKAHNISGVSEDRDSLQILFDMDKRIKK